MEINRTLFYEEVKDAVQKRLGDAVDVSIREVKKNNQIVTGLVFTPNVETQKIAPTIYFNNVETDVSAVADRMLKTYEEHKNGFTDKLPDFTDYAQIKDKLSIRAMNVKDLSNPVRSNPYLEGKVYDVIEDIAFIPTVILGSENGQTGSVSITEHLLDGLGVSKETLMADAKENIMRNASVKSMGEIMAEMMGMPYDERMDPPGPKMTVVTTANRVNGSGLLYCVDVLQEVAEKENSDMAILPSSIHEFIMVPVMEDMNALTAMVREVNAGEVALDDQLSDQAYIYSKEKEKLMTLDEYTREQEMERE